MKKSLKYFLNDFYALKQEHNQKIIENTKVSEDSLIFPINVEDQFNIFYKNYINKKRYNPIFNYNLQDLQKKLKFKRIYLDNLESFLLKNDHIKQKYPRIFNYLFKNLNTIDLSIRLMSVLGKKDFKDIIYEKFKPIKPKEYQFITKKYLFETQNTNSNLISPFEFAKIITDIFRDVLNLEKFKIILSDNYHSNRFSKYGQFIRLTTHRDFDIYLIKRTIIHEFVHMFRYFNGKRQINKLLKLTLDYKYIIDEEGIATYFTEQLYPLYNGIFNSKQKYITNFDHTIFVYLAQNNDFYDTFKQCLDIFKPYNQDKQTLYSFFKHTLRAKRGISDTNMNYGYTKDAVYYRGYKKIRGLMKANQEQAIVEDKKTNNLGANLQTQPINKEIQLPSQNLDKFLFVGKVSYKQSKSLEKYIRMKRVKYDFKKLKKIKEILEEEVK